MQSKKQRVLETSINRKIIVDQVASLLYAWGLVQHGEEITNIQFGELFGYSQVELCPIKIFISSPQGCETGGETVKDNGEGERLQKGV